MAEAKRSRRFLPSDPRVEEPYRLTPQLALRIAVLGFVAHHSETAKPFKWVYDAKVAA